MQHRASGFGPSQYRRGREMRCGECGRLAPAMAFPGLPIAVELLHQLSALARHPQPTGGDRRALLMQPPYPLVAWDMDEIAEHAGPQPHVEVGDIAERRVAAANALDD